MQPSHSRSKTWWVARESNSVLKVKSLLLHHLSLQPLGPEVGPEPTRTSDLLATTEIIRLRASPEDSGKLGANG